MQQREINHWFIDEPEVLRIIGDEGYHYLPMTTPGWYESDYPIQFNGSTQFLRSRGTHLTCLSDEELRVKSVEDFDRRLRG